MKANIKIIKQNISTTINKLDDIVVNGGRVCQNDPLMIRLIKLRRELLKATLKHKC